MTLFRKSGIHLASQLSVFCSRQNYANWDQYSPSHMQQLYSLCQAKKKVWKDLPNGTHNETVAQPHFFNYLVDFISEVT